MMRFTAQAISLDAAAGDAPRTISGIAVPYQVNANTSTGVNVRIGVGALSRRPSTTFAAEHDASRIGMVTAREETDEGCLLLRSPVPGR